jgi:hypothetical protein
VLAWTFVPQRIAESGALAAQAQRDPHARHHMRSGARYLVMYDPDDYAGLFARRTLHAVRPRHPT